MFQKFNLGPNPSYIHPAHRLGHTVLCNEGKIRVLPPLPHLFVYSRNEKNEFCFTDSHSDLKHVSRIMHSPFFLLLDVYSTQLEEDGNSLQHYLENWKTVSDCQERYLIYNRQAPISDAPQHIIRTYPATARQHVKLHKQRPLFSRALKRGLQHTGEDIHSRISHKKKLKFVKLSF